MTDTATSTVPTSYTGLHITVPADRNPRAYCAGYLMAHASQTIWLVVNTRDQAAAATGDVTHRDVLVQIRDTTGAPDEQLAFTLGEFIDWCWT